MKNQLKIKIYILLLIIPLYSCMESTKVDQVNSGVKLWYDKPAESWAEALPIGNGRLGAMVFGGIAIERIQLNEESLWAGSKINNNNPKASKNLTKIQDLLLDEESNKALELAEKYLLGTPPRLRSYQTLGDLNLEYDGPIDSISNYQRELDLPCGIASTSFEMDGKQVSREVFVSAVDNIIVVYLNSHNSGALSFNLELTREFDAVIKTDSSNTIKLEGQIIDKDDPLSGPGGKHMKFASVVKVINNGGTLNSSLNKIGVRDADEVTILITAATDYNINMLNFDRSIDPMGICQEIISKAEAHSYDDLKNRHINDHQEIFNRVEINLGENPNQNIPTNERLERVKNGKRDDDLITLYFQYGRYLLMNSSRFPGVLPANLQGIWNEHFLAPWNSDFHTNINLQMNYWPANVTNLPETVLPLTDFFTRLLNPGRITAMEMYNARGWMMHHTTDLFGRTGLMDGIEWGTSPLAGAWMTLSFWRHYQFTNDEFYLRDKAYPIMKEAAQFIMDFLINDQLGNLVTAPSMSPENSFINPKDGKEYRMTYGATIDIQIIQELFNACIDAAHQLNEDKEFINDLKSSLDKLPPILIGKDGTIREWIKDYKEAEPGHRHMSHLFGLHPGTKITPDTPELFEAARKTIEKRLANGGGHTGWSRAWIVNFYARLLDGEKAYEHLNALLQKSTLPNLFDSHPPFQIDGNFGGTAGISEMILQSHNNMINLLPALPLEWKDGFVKGLKAHGNFTIDIYWNNGELKKLAVKSLSGGLCNIKYKNKTIQLETEIGKEYLLNSNLQ